MGDAVRRDDVRSGTAVGEARDLEGARRRRDCLMMAKVPAKPGQDRSSPRMGAEWE